MSSRSISVAGVVVVAGSLIVGAVVSSRAQAASEHTASAQTSAQTVSQSQGGVATDRAQTASSRASGARAPWFGLALPKGLGDPHNSILDLTGKTPPPAILPGSAMAETSRQLADKWTP